jgi:tetratricopeptide (TPR) repeat protein
MAIFSSDHMAAPSGRDAWQHDNERGLALAAGGDWTEASEAFAAAADSLARALPSDSRGAHEPLALVLSNLAQALYRCGRLDDAMLQAQRACALRVAIAGEDGMPVARARMDLAVMLASAGRLDEATMLVQRSISAIEHRVGEEDARLAIVLENAARIALASGQPANAEPLLIRLHALLDAHDLSTSRADALLTRVANVRAAQQAIGHTGAAGGTVDASTTAHEARGPVDAEEVHVEVHDETPVALPAFDGEDAAQVYAHATVAEHEEWEDQPLRDAVAVTDVLLRTTPSGVPIVPAAPAPASEPMQVSAAVEGLAFDLDLAFDEATPTSTETSVSTDDAALGDVDLVDFVLPASMIPPGASPPPAAAAPINTPPAMVGRLSLDFAVEHGPPEDETVIEGPPISSPVPGDVDVAPSSRPTPTVVPVTPIITSGPTIGIAPMADIVRTGPLMDATPAGGAKSPTPAASTATRTERPTGPSGERPVRRSAEPRVVLPKPAPPKKTGTVVAIIAGAVVIGGAAAAFFLLR